MLHNDSGKYPHKKVTTKKKIKIMEGTKEKTVLYIDVIESLEIISDEKLSQIEKEFNFSIEDSKKVAFSLYLRDFFSEDFDEGIDENTGDSFEIQYCGKFDSIREFGIYWMEKLDRKYHPFLEKFIDFEEVVRVYVETDAVYIYLYEDSFYVFDVSM